ncbi:MAG: hypothetical protein KTR32_08155 [Granulosicoccus sp.]|nr:hypothetical protein [Granulosicoccus sp.]
MSMKSDFTDDEWFLISAMPGMIGAAMSNAAPSGVIGTIKEMSATMQSAVKAKSDFPDSELINALVQKAENWAEAKEKMADYRQRAEARLSSANVTNRDELQKLALGECKQAIALVDEKCSAEDAKIYKQWTANVARAVAEAAKEGSVLGFGGERVSESEQKLLAEIESILGVQGGVLIA